MPFVYIVLCADNTYYTGWTTDLEHRISVHNSGNGAKYTRSRLPVTLVYSEEYATKAECLRREFAIKQLDRRHKDKLITNDHPKPETGRSSS